MHKSPPELASDIGSITASPPQEHNAHPAYRPDIDGLRAVAILSVVLFHAFPSKLRGGFVGVDIFFVISGFLISTIIFRSLQRGDFSFTEFYAHRIKRIFPALILVLAACYAFGWFALLPDEYKQLGKHMAAGAGFVQNFVIWKEAGYFDTASELKPLMHLWSLAIEEQFYLLYPVLIWGAWRMGLNVLTVVILLGLLSFGLNVGGIEKEAIKTFFLPQTRFWELLAGSVLAYVQLYKPAPFAAWLKRSLFHPLVFRQPPAAQRREAVLNNLLSGFGLFLIVLAVFGLHKGKLFPGWWALFPVLGACLLILAGPQAWVNRKILANRLMVFVGLISYPLYLWHWPILAFARIMESETPSRTIRMAAVVLSFVLAWLTYRLVERPIRFGRNTWVKTATLCVLMSVVGYVGYNAFMRDGLEFRYRQLTERNAQFIWVAENNQNEECKTSFPEFAKTGYCAKSKASGPTILLLGDSHANHLYPGMAAVTNSTVESVLNFGEGACLPFFDVASFQKGGQDPCADRMNRSLKVAEDTKSTRIIVVSSRGPLYLYGKGFGEIADEQSHDRALASTNNPSVSDFREVFKTGMRSTMERLTKKDKRVVFVLDVPELGFDPRSCVDIRPLRLTTRQIRQPCAVSRKDFDARNHEYREIVFSVLRDYPTVKIFDAAAELCDDKWCWAMKDGNMLYRDDDHLSVQGSEYIARTLSKLIDPAHK
ncbi:acyltransferase family protein [Rhodoferax antarcticus]|uniref:Acyltransferase family protein n=1 Tax=Rhodoferax antarcticus ANT.BR TaxID=1111071 RepID=A0A1Q8YAG1_9BURK|nr:acyltransferase family protein [Rhodoferax antarcticus]OLP05024.1 acyltransferase family protein [Rhodoferax antarcticus ANT.BR]